MMMMMSSCLPRHWSVDQTHVGPPPHPPLQSRAGPCLQAAGQQPVAWDRTGPELYNQQQPVDRWAWPRVSPACSSTMAAMGPEDRTRTIPGLPGLPGRQACVSTTQSSNNQSTVVNGPLFAESRHHRSKPPCWSRVAPTTQPGNITGDGEALSSFLSPESVEMDEIMAAMVLTTLSCSPLVHNTPQTDPGPGPGGAASTVDMECGNGELSDSGSSGYWSWDHGNVSPAPSPSVTEMDSSPDEGLHMELEQGEELPVKKPKSSFRGVYRCLWPSCGKVLTSSVGIKRHIRVLHLGSSDHSQREEDFYYTKICSETTDAAQQAPPLATPTPVPLSSESHIPPAHRHRSRSNSSSGPGQSRPSPLSQSAPSSFWQIRSEHLYQACSPVQISVAPRSPVSHGWSPSPTTSASAITNIPTVKPRCRSVSIGEQWLQQNRLQPISAHCSFRKGRGEAKKCRKVYGVERKDQWCTACRWKKACQRFPD
ncbi:zinc finger protein 395-like isoform X2 [Gouania willdenowi]|uniref:zinc finger protein 395-like isoform X2 n=1 Tax=Gouania willdenowi TaxID=441366 RepID=UPI001055B43A|nr:zinc finger protein 395-like isoform X2 [Gouania willdenowi]